MTAKRRAPYPAAAYGNLHAIEGRSVFTWRRRIFCPNPGCLATRQAATGRARRRQLGRQQIRASLDPHDTSRVAGFRVERIELARVLIPLSSLADGTPSFGLPQAVRRTSPTPGVLAERPLHRAVPVLASVDTPYPQVGRHSPQRTAGGAGSFWSLALGPDEAGRPFVVTCPDCRQQCLVDGTLPEAELRTMTAVAY